MILATDHVGRIVATAPESPTIPDVRRLVWLMRRAGMMADLHRCTTDERGHPYQPVRYVENPEPPFTYVLTTERGDFERWTEEEAPYAIVNADDCWDAMEGMGLEVSLSSVGRWDERTYEAEAWHPDASSFPLVLATGPTREATLFAAAVGAERLTRPWRYSRRAGLWRPIAWRRGQ